MTDKENSGIRMEERLRRRIDLERLEAGEPEEVRPVYREPSVYSRPGPEYETEETVRDADGSGAGSGEYYRFRDVDDFETYAEDDFGYGDGENDTPIQKPVVREKKKRKKRHRLLRFLLSVFLILLFLTTVLGAVIYFFVSKTDYQPYAEIREDPLWNLEKKGKDGVMNILLIGTDGRSRTEGSRSDAVILCSICPLQHKIYLTSILRDCYTTIPDYGRNRINHAYQMGGARLLAETIEMNFHVRIDHYAKVDFFSFVDIIDRLGGVDVTVTDEEVHYFNAYLCDVNLLTGRPAEENFISSGGTCRLTGRQALAYSRIRYIGTDFARTNRQRTVIRAAMDTVKKNPLKAAAAADGLLPQLVTDFSDLDMTLLILRSVFLLNYEVVQDQIPFDGMWWNDTMPNGQEVLNMDFDSVTAELRSRIYK